MSDLPDFERGIARDAIQDGTAVAGSYRGSRVLLVRRGDTITALSGDCTHLGAPLETGIVTANEVRCPWHHARFSADSGAVTGGPAAAPLGCFTVAESDGMVRVTGRASETTGHPAKEPVDRVVVIGTGAAGYALALHLAQAGQGGRVTMVTHEDAAPYDRTYLSKQYLSGAKGRDDCFLPAPGGNGLPNVAVRTATRIVAIDRDAKTVRTQAGDDIAYDVLVLATGATPMLPDFDGKDGERVFVLRSIADADRLTNAAEKAKRAVVLGGSFIGLEVAASLRQRGLSVDVIDKGAIPLEPVLGAEVGRFVRKLHEDEGVRFHPERQVAAYDGTSVTLDNGTMIEADLLVVGAGVTPSVDLARDAGLALAEEEDGIRVDGHFVTSDASIRAIGDVAQYPDPRLGRNIRVEHWVLAQRHGEHLAQLLLGNSDAPFTETPFFWSGHFGTQLRYIGHAQKPDPVRRQGSVDDGEFALFFGPGDDGDRAEAMVSCGKDQETLEVEERWNRAARAD